MGQHGNWKMDEEMHISDNVKAADVKHLKLGIPLPSAVVDSSKPGEYPRSAKKKAVSLTQPSTNRCMHQHGTHVTCQREDELRGFNIL